MKEGPNIFRIAALIGDPARGNMLTRLMNGQALTAGELAREAGVSPATASGHLAQLLDGGLLHVEKQGRHRYYRLAGAEIATAIEALMDVAEHAGEQRVRPGPRDAEMRQARICYDHLAGERGVELFSRLTAGKLITLGDDEVAITARGERCFEAFGIDIGALKAARRPACRICLDWSERRPHLAGGLGAAVLDRLFDLRWAYRVAGTRIIRFTPLGYSKFERLFRDEPA
jgi:DNA-binding transcriptional ArsR family regulator